MLNQTITIPEQDYSLFLEVVKRFRWKIANEQNNLTPNILAELDKRMENYKLNPDSAIDNDEVIKLINIEDQADNMVIHEWHKEIVRKRVATSKEADFTSLDDTFKKLRLE